MADTTEGDADLLYLLAPALIALIAGLVTHSFIIGVNVTDWWRGRSVTPVDHVVIALGVSRICSLCTVTLYFLIDFLLKRSLFFSLIQSIVGTVYSFCHFVNFWLTSLLSVVFYFKITNLHTRLFLYLKGLIIRRPGYFIVASLLLSAANCLLPMLNTKTEVTKGVEYNNTMDNLLKCIRIDPIYYFTLGDFFPFIFYCISSALLFVSLYHHTTRMKMSSNLSINLETYYSAMRFVSVTFIYNTTHFITHFVCVLFYYLYCVNLKWILIILGFLPVLHSSYLIYRTAKLRDQMSKVLQNVLDFLLQKTNKKT